MQVFISDVHLTDGSSGETINPGAFQVFAENLETLMKSIPEKSAVTELKIVLLGDIFDVIRSTLWLDDEVNVRPWSPKGPKQSGIVLKIVQAILAKNKESINKLRNLKNLAVTRGISFELNYVIGNHDWLINRYDVCRNEIAKALGIGNGLSTPEFPVELFDPGYKTFATHGDRYDSFNYMGDRDKSSIGDAIVIELLNRFPIMVKKGLTALVSLGKMTSAESDDIVKYLKELDNVRPLLEAPSWVLMVLSRTTNASAQQVIKDAWKRPHRRPIPNL